jgi:murein DD-endopeptidase MepM/ murein hydrolase activator NlpD
VRFRAIGPDTWLRASMAVALAQIAFVAVVRARVGLVAVVLWYAVPPLVALSAATLLAVALARSWRSRALPDRRQLAGLGVLAVAVGSSALLRAYPSSHDDRPSRVPFRLPLDGPVTIAWGGPTLAVNYHAAMPDQRWAYDLLVTEAGRSFRKDGSRLEDYLAYGRPVLAPAAGTVRAIRDGEPDGPVGQWRVRRATGNHIVLQVADREFLVIAHLQPGSIAVTQGDRVAAGQVVARVGNSGNSSEPHVHLHLQDSPFSYLGEGVPFYFHGYCARGTIVPRGMPAGGRERRSRMFPGAFLGDIIEHAADMHEPQACRAAGLG